MIGCSGNCRQGRARCDCDLVGAEISGRDLIGVLIAGAVAVGAFVLGVWLGAAP